MGAKSAKAFDYEGINTVIENSKAFKKGNWEVETFGGEFGLSRYRIKDYLYDMSITIEKRYWPIEYDSVPYQKNHHYYSVRYNKDYIYDVDEEKWMWKNSVTNIPTVVGLFGHDLFDFFEKWQTMVSQAINEGVEIYKKPVKK